MEVPVAGSDQVKWARLMVPAQLPPSEPCCPPSSDMAGTAAFRSPSRCFTIWRVHKLSPAILELFDVEDNEGNMSGLQLVFEEPLSPYIAVYPEQVQMNYKEGSLFVCVVTVSGVVYILKIRAFCKYRSVSAITRSDIFQFSLVSDLARLDEITSFAGLGGSICVGGKSGSILCYPIEQSNVEAKENSFELKDSDAILGRLWGLVARAKSAGSVQSLNMQLHKDRALLFALHEDGTFRLWNLHDRSRLLSFSLSKGDFTGYVPKMMWVQEQDIRIPEQDIRSGSRQVAFLLQKKGVTSEDTVHVYDLQLGQADGTAGQATLHFQLQTPVIQGTVLDLKLLSDSFWKLEVVDGQFHLKCFGTKREELLESCELLEAELEDQLFQSPDDDWEDLILFRESINRSAKTELRLPVSEMFFSRILQSGVYQQHPLHKLLAKYKRNIPETDFGMLTRDGIRKEIMAVIETENTGDDKMDCLMQWKAFCKDYVTLWKHSNTPYALIFDYTGNIGLIRRQSLSVKRSLSNFEKIHIGSCNEGDFLDLLFKCTSTIVKQLGRVPCSAFGEVLLGNKHISVSHIVLVFLHLLEVGYDQSAINSGATHIGVDVGRKKASEYHQRHRKLELQLILDLQHLRDFAGSWGHVLDNVEKYINQLTQDTRFSRKKDYPEGSEYGIISKRLVLKSTAQLSWTHFEAAKKLLVLLGYLIKIKGQVGISSNEVSRIQLDLVVQLKEILIRSLLVHWLCTNFAEVAPTEDFSLHLSTLHLDSVAANKTNNQHLGVQEMTLAEILLSACPKSLSKGPFLRSKGILTSDYLLYATKIITSWLMWGEANDKSESLSSHSVTLAAPLLQHGQYTTLQEFLRLVDDFCNELELHELKGLKGEWCARLHFLGCGLLGQARTSLKEPAIESRVEKAVHCFFRVASVVGQDREDLEALLLKIGMKTNFLVHGDISSWKFHYYEWVMQIFEQNHELDGACQFAHAALQEMDATAKNSVSEDTLETSTAVLTIKGCLWANIFKFSLDKKKFKEAYCAIMSNPDKESKYVCLRRFLIVLCEQKAAEVLCGSELPYAGMLERVEQELLLKAHHSDLTANPNPFKLLYSFHMQRSNWRRAALYMYLYSVRMKEMGLAEAGLSVTFVLQEQLSGLAAAINALHLVDSMYAWLDLESDVLGGISSRPASKRIRVYANNDAGYLTQGRRAYHVDLQELEKEYTITLAELLLIEAGVQLNLHRGESSPENILVLLVQSGLYEMAFTVLFQFWNDSSLKSELERIFRIMAERWCMHQQDNAAEKPRSSEMSLLQSDRKLLLLPSSEAEVPLETAKSSLDLATKDVMSNATCNSLQICLEKYMKLHPHLLVVVAETMLNIDKLIELPFWLVDMLKGGRQAGGEGMSMAGANPSALLRIYLDFGRVTEAAMLFLDYVKAWSNLLPGDVIKRKKMCGVWFPYTLVDRLKGCLSELKRCEQVERLERLLESSLSRHFDQAHTDSSDVKSLVQP
eukprot:c17647_g1_i1 orf=202-4674(+)